MKKSVFHDKKRKIGLSTTTTTTAATTAEVSEDAGIVVEFSSMEDVVKLLNERMKGKNKSDYKGKSEQMMDYIKRLRDCIKFLRERDDDSFLQIEKLRGIILSEGAKFADLEGLMRGKEEEVAYLKDKFEKEAADKLVVMESLEKEREVRIAAENSRDALDAELGKANQEASNSAQQVKSLQDMNKRLQDYNASLQQYNTRLQSDATANNEAMARLHKEKNAMMESLSSLRSHSNTLQEQLSSMKVCQQEVAMEKEGLKNKLECLRNEAQKLREDRDLQLSNVQSLAAELEKCKQDREKSAIELEALTKETHNLEATCSSQKEQIKMLRDQVTAANGNLEEASSATRRTRMEYQEQRRVLEDLQERLADAELKVTDGEKLRKKLHNTILELKGNIRVFCRVRPLNPDREGNGSEMAAVSYPPSLEMQGRGIDLMHNGKKHTFTFDKVFHSGASQEDVFVEISQLVQSALDGYKVCIFAYGQTGSGKTYTMMGKQDASQLKGLIPRSLEQIFEASQSLSRQGWTYKMQASMLEIYNETVRDLLGSNRSNGPDASTTAGRQYAIKHDRNGNTLVSDLTVVDVCSITGVSYLLQQAANSRSVGRTHMNEQSSRSHFVFILRISGDNESTDQHVQGVLNLIDLAGSERLDKSGSTGDRLKETQHINKSLLSLSDVISSIAKKEDHIPFRNSKLTYLLQPCLGGESKTLMFVNISPESSSTGESKCSLQFASKVNSCEIGVPRRQTQIRPSV